MKTMVNYTFYFFYVSIFMNICVCEQQIGPDPWNYVVNDEINANDIPPDLKILPKQKVQSEEKSSYGEWFLKRMLAIILKGGQVKKAEDGSIDISLQMRFNKDQWVVLEDLLKPDIPLTENKIRRSIGYLADSIYKPNIGEKVIMAWSDYVHAHLIEYKSHITWTLGALGSIGALIWLLNHVSRKHVIIMLFLMLYLYEVFISYKEVEQKELEMFLKTVNDCKWYFWSSSCDVPKPDPLIFLKHMNPLKIGVRMFTAVISEPMVVISETTAVMIHGITDGLWFPLDKIMYGVLNLSVNLSLIYLLIMIVFNYILNVPFNLSFGLMSIGVQQRNRTFFSNRRSSNNTVGEKISTETVNKFLEVCALALGNGQNNALSNAQNNALNNGQNNVLSNSQNNNTDTKKSLNIPQKPAITRSASTGRLPNVRTCEFSYLTSENSIRRRNVQFEIGAGDSSRNNS